MNILHTECNPEMAKDRKLPYNSYLVCYMGEDQVLKHDIAMSGTAVELFDTYYDKYKKLYHYVKGGNDGLNKIKREQMFVQLLEALQELSLIHI